MRKKREPRLGALDKVLIFCAVFMTVFVVVMILLYLRFASVPDTLITCVFAAITGEAGICGWIKNAKIKQSDREYMEAQEEKRKKENNG